MLFDRVKTIDTGRQHAESGMKRSLGPVRLTLLGVGAIIGTGVFTLTGEAAQKAGPAMLISFVIAAVVCGLASLCYAELASMIPVSGSAYTYTYAAVGEVTAWVVGWALILEYAIGGSAVASGWSGYFVGQVQSHFGFVLSPSWVNPPASGGYVDVPAAAICAAATALLVLGTAESAFINALLVALKIAALSLFIVISIPTANVTHLAPFMPNGWHGVAGAAASIFFAYVGFDAVSTAAEETVNPQRNVPIGLIGALLISTVFYLIVAYGVAASPLGAQPVTDAAGVPLAPGSFALTARCGQLASAGLAAPISCSREVLVHVAGALGWLRAGNLIGLVAMVTLPSVVLLMLYGQTRIFFAMARDGLLPPILAVVHPRFRTPHVVTIITGVVAMAGAALLPIGQLADYSNSGTLFPFVLVAISVLVLRRKDPERRRGFRTPLVGAVAPLTIAGCVYLYCSLPVVAMLVLPVWGGVGLVFYFAYGRKRSVVGMAATDA